MATKYDQFESESHEKSDLDIEDPGEGHLHNFNIQDQEQVVRAAHVPQPVVYQQYAQSTAPQQPMNILHSPGYQLVSAQSSLSNWIWYTKIIAWILVVLGGFSTFVMFLGILSLGAFKLQVLGPHTIQEIDYSDLLLLLVQLARVITSVITTVIGVLILKAIKNPSREATWKCFRKAGIAVFVYFVTFSLEFIIRAVASAAVYDEWEEMPNKQPGNYEFRDQYNNLQFVLSVDKETREIVGDIDLAGSIMARILSGLAFAC